MNIFRRIMARAQNDAGERIESLRFSVPALRVGVLEYGPGQLQTNNSALDGRTVKLYYPPEAVSDEKFLKSLETAPVVVGGHDASTNEQNKKIDGWAHNVFFDTTKNAAMLDGVVKGAKEVAYIRSNLGAAGFGASAFVDIYSLKVENGMTADGQEYNAVANELRATHVALAPHVRDPENKIRVTNAVCVRNTGEMMEAKNTIQSSVKAAIQREFLNVVERNGRLYITSDVGWTKREIEKELSIKIETGPIEYQADDSVLAEITSATVKNTEEKTDMELSDDKIAAIIKNVVKEMTAEMMTTAKNITPDDFIKQSEKEGYSQHAITMMLTDYGRMRRLGMSEEDVDKALLKRGWKFSTKNAMRGAEVTYVTDDGKTGSYRTSINGTDAEIKEYFRPGKRINIGDGPRDRMAMIKSVKVLNTAVNINPKFNFLYPEERLSLGEKQELDRLLDKIAELTRRALSAGSRTEEGKKLVAEADKLSERALILRKKQGF